MHIITLLGTGGYSETTYSYEIDGKAVECRTKYFGEAAAAWFASANVSVLVTREAEEAHWAKFVGRVPRAIKHEISTGVSENELWQIFSALIGVVEELPDGEEVVFDVTHGFRSMQLLLQLGAAYLNTLERIKTLHILYGAYVKDQPQTPVLDLAPFLRLLNWANAANQFIATGDAREIGALLKGDETIFRKAGNFMEDLSKALLSCRSGEKQVRLSAGNLIHELERLEGTKDIRSVPFGLIAERVRDSFLPLTEADELSRGLNQIEWYVKNGHYPHGILLAREWMVSFRLSKSSTEDRNDAEVWLNERCNPKRPAYITPPAEWNKFTKCWDKLGQLRNDIGHFKEQAESERIRKRALKLPEELREAIEYLDDGRL